jgi:Ribonuclease G/E
VTPALARVLELARQLEEEASGFEVFSVDCPVCEKKGRFDAKPSYTAVNIRDPETEEVVSVDMLDDTIQVECECTKGRINVEVDLEDAGFDHTRRELRLALVELDLEQARGVAKPLYRIVRRRKRIAL